MINRILLIDVDIPDQDASVTFQHYTHHPIGLLYLVSAVGQVIPEIEFKVFHTATNKDALPEVERLIADFQPDLVGLRALSIARDHFDLIAKRIREYSPGLPLIAGGPYPSSSFRELLSAGIVDLVVNGEGEVSLVELLQRMRKDSVIPKDIRGTSLILDGEIHLNEPRPPIQNIDEIAFPDYTAIALQDYQGLQNHAHYGTDKSAFILGSRGCPFQCFYCHQMFGKKIRRRSPKNILAEMQEHMEKRGIRDFVFLDDIFNVPMPDAKTILRMIAKELPGVRINFPNGLRSDQIDEEMLDLFQEAGTIQMSLAIESAVPRLQKLMGKNLDVAKAEKAIQGASRRFITRLYFIVGFPTETYDDAMETIRYASRFEYATQPMLSVLRLYNNSRLFELLEATKEQAEAIAEQEKKSLHLELFKESMFYGDLFSRDKVPLTSRDLNELLIEWMRNVLLNPTRIKKSHEVVTRFYSNEQMLEFYKFIFNKNSFTERDLEKLLVL